MDSQWYDPMYTQHMKLDIVYQTLKHVKESQTNEKQSNSSNWECQTGQIWLCCSGLWATLNMGEGGVGTTKLDMPPIPNLLHLLSSINPNLENSSSLIPG